jgi:hypothetical protein
MLKEKMEPINITNNSDQDGEAFVYACEVNAWYMDFGTSSHLSHCKKRFKTYESISLVKIYIGDNSNQDTIGKGNIEIVMTMGDTAIEGMITYILHVP